MSNADRIRVSVVKETAFGTTPTNPAWLTLPTTGHSMRDRIGYQQSRTITTNRNVADYIRLSKSSGGGIPLELRYSPNGEGLMQVLTAAFGVDTETAAATGITVATTVGTKNVVNAGGTWAADLVEDGDIIWVETGADAGYYRILSGASTDTVTVDAPAVFAGSAAQTASRGARIKNGVFETTFSIEVAFLDLQKAIVFTGQAPDSVDINIADEAITTANLSFSGASSTPYENNNGTTDLFGPGNPTYTDASTHPVLDAIGVPVIRSMSAAYAAKSVRMALSNGVSSRTQVGALGPQSLRWGQFTAEGNVASYLTDLVELTAYADNTPSDLWFIALDANDQGYSLSFPQTKYTDAGADATGPNSDILTQLTTAAYKHPTELITARLQRWD